MSLLECSGITKSFGGIQALDGVDIAVDEGEILGLVGPNGSGKSTLINVVSGFYPADGGRIVFRGTDISELRAHRLSASGIARTHQIPRPFHSMTPRENVAMSSMFGRRARTPAPALADTDRWLEFTGLMAVADLPISELTLHELKFLELAKALASEPALLLLDEVLAGLNPTELDESVRMIRRINEEGITIVIVEHIIRAVTALSGRIAVLDHGRVIAVGEPAAVMSDPVVVTAYLGTR